MTSAWLQARGRAKDAPITTDTDPFATQSYDLAKATNEDIDALNADKDRYFNLLNQQYEHMFNVKERLPGQLLNMTKSGVVLATEKRKWDETNELLNHMYDNMTGGEGIVHLEDDDPRLAKDPVIRKGTEIEEMKQSIRPEVMGAAYNAIDENRQELASKILLPEMVDKEFYKNIHNLKVDGQRYLKGSGLEMRVQIPDKFDAEGKPIFRTFNTAHDLGEARYILGRVYANYMHSTTGLSRENPGQWRRRLAIPMANMFLETLNQKAKDLGLAQAEVQKQLRGEELNERLTDNPGHLFDWMKTHKEAYKGSYRETRLAAANEIAYYGADGSIPRSTVEDVIDYEFEAFDSTPEKPHMVTVGDYWKKEASIMLAGVAKFEKEEMNAEIDRTKEAALGEFKDIKEQYDKKKVLPTQDEKQQIQSQLMSTHGLSVEQLPDAFKNWAAQGDAEDELLDYELTKRYNNGETLKASDLQFSDPKLRAEWLKKIGGGMNTTRRDSFIIGKVDWKTQNTLGEDGRGDEWRAYQDNATIEFNRAYFEAKDNGATDSEAFKAGMDAVVDGLTKDDSWRNWGGVQQSADSITSLESAKRALSKDNTLLDSDKPWIGEETHVEAAVKYLQGDVKNIPQYYRNFPSIKLQPIQLMKRRLTALGLLKDGELVLPEEEIRPDLQNMFIKPSPARTYRVITDQDQGPEWIIKQYSSDGDDPDYILNQLKKYSRMRSQNAQRFSTTDISYRNTVDIPPELEEKFNAQVANLGLWNQLPNLQPEVAKALVADTLMT